MLTTHQAPLEPSSSISTPLPVTLPALPGLDLRALYETVRTHGDFFDAQLIGNYVLFLLTDIAGTRDQAHPIAFAAQATFRTRAPELFGASGINLTDCLADLAHEINLTVLRSAHAAHFAPTFLGCYDLSLHLLTYLNAGGQTAIFRDSDGASPLPNVSIPLGLFSHRTYEPAVQAFEPGAKLLLTTKGATDAGHAEHSFGQDRALSVLKEFTGATAQDLCRATLASAEKIRHRHWQIPFLKHAPLEDLTAVALIRTS